MKSTKTGTFVADDLTQLLGRPIAYHRIFAHLGGDANSAVFLSQCLHWTPRASHKNKKAPASEGWFFKTQAEFWEETGLTRYNQETARRKWRKLGVLEEKRVGQQGHIYYRINLHRLAELLKALISGQHSQFQMWESNSSKSYNPTSGTVTFPQNIKETKTTTKSTAKTTSTANDDVFSDSLQRDLIANGVTESRAKTLAQNFDEEMRRRLKMLPHVEIKTTAAQFLSARPHERWTEPQKIAQSAAAEQRDAAAVADATARIERAANERKTQTAGHEENKKLDAIFESLPAREKSAIERAARQRVGPVAALIGDNSAALSAEIRNQLREKLKNEEVI